MTWYEDFLIAYRSTPADRLQEHYDGLSSFVVVTTADNRWTRPEAGARDIANRLIQLNVIAVQWGMVTCQRIRGDDGLIVVMTTADGRRRQILVVYRTAAAGPVVRNHFYVAAYPGEAEGVGIDVGYDGGGDGGRSDSTLSFQRRFEDWATALDPITLERHRVAMITGLNVTRELYATWRNRRGDGWSRWRHYAPDARFTCAEDNDGDGLVYVGQRLIRDRYELLALGYGPVRLQAIECCWSVAAAAPRQSNGRKRALDAAAAVLIVGTVPNETMPGGDRVDREFVQLLMVDMRTRKIRNDVLSIQAQPRDDAMYHSLSLPPPSPSSFTSSSPSSTTSLPLSSSSSSSSSLSSSMLMAGDCSESSVDDFYGRVDYFNDDDDDEEKEVEKEEDDDGLAKLRSNVTINALKIRCGRGDGGGNNADDAPANFNPRPVVAGYTNTAVSKLNPRQLFIGCVPLHVKYGQLKLLFERFGEVTYVKVYEGYNKQTGAKMSHNYAFLFFKDEASVERAIAASPVPLDANWNLNVSRPHHHSAAAAAIAAANSGVDR